MSLRRLMPIFILFLSSTFGVLAQNGNIRGTVFDDANGDYLPGVAIQIEGTTIGTTTDLDGKFSFNVARGVYNLKISFISFQTVTISNVEVQPGQNVLLDNIRLKEASFELSEVTVTASAIRNTESALLSIKQKSASVIDGVSAANFRKIGDSDAAAVMKRVPGVSVEGGKYVFVRGLGDRYTKTILNGMDVPGLDPDRNTIQMDIFPTGIIDNIIVHKTFTADLPADFTGGIVDITLKDFPEERTGNISLSTSYNASSHYNPNYLTYNGGKYDYLGFDDGTRAIPAVSDIPFFTDALIDPQGEPGQRYREILQSFDPQMAAFKQRNNGDYSLGISLGNQLPLKSFIFGFYGSLSYKNTTDFFENAEFGRYGIDLGNPDNMEMDVREFQLGDYGVDNVFWSVNGGVAAKTKSSKIRLNVMHLQNGESTAGLFRYEGSSKGANFSAAQHNLEYNQRSLSNLLLEGKHNLGWRNLVLDWKFSPTLSKMEDPDVRFTRFEDRGQGQWRITTEVGLPERIWRELEEVNLNGMAKASLEFELFGQKNKLDFGGSHSFKERDFVIRNFMLNIRNVPLTGDPNEFFLEENLWPYNGSASRGTTFDAMFVPVNPNQFNSSVITSAAFVSAEIVLLAKLRTVMGLRVEQFTQRYTGQDQQGANILENEVVLDNTDLFPSLNLIYAVTDKQNIRASFTRTIARPSFKEMSYAEIYDPLTGRTFIGGMFRDADDIAGVEYWGGNLVSTYIQNYDLRWELFQNQGQMVSLSAFYKSFENPIEIVQFVTQDAAFQPRNVGKGQVAGIEFETRQSLNFLSASLANFQFTTNITYTTSRIELSATELKSRQSVARTGQKIEEYRDMAGQAPYIVNAGFAYNGGESGFWNGFEWGLFYNVQGQTLQVVGIVDRPDIYSLPFHSLNMNVNKRFGQQKQWQIGLKVDNILNAKRESIFESFKAENQYYERLSRGTTFQLRLGYNFL